MRAVVQRVTRAAVSVVEAGEEHEVGRIGLGLAVLIGVAATDTAAEAERIADKIAALRIFPDEEGKLNRDVREAGGAVLAISQFTLLADTRKGRRPSFSAAARPEHGQALYEAAIARLRAAGLTVQMGRFGAHMHLEILNDGPVTIILDTEEWATPSRFTASGTP
jgi:D-tyrosyl-tRNA(Tyr) deacylase